MILKANFGLNEIKKKYFFLILKLATMKDVYI